MEILDAQRDFFKSGATLDIKFRRQQLKKLLKAINKWEKPIYESLQADLHKSYEEAYLTEVSIVKKEIRKHIRHLGRWSGRKRVAAPLTQFPSHSFMVTEPLGNALIIAPWNYPFQLLLNPLVGAISSGCTAILKPSPYVPHVSKVLQDMIDYTFDKNYIALVQGHRDVNQELLAQRFDLIFFTGSPRLGRSVMEAASKNLTPVILELGGKSPCVVDRDADIAKAARRIAWGKTLNCGQTCIAPDYLLLHKDIKGQFIETFKKEIGQLYGADTQQSPYYVRMVNDRAFERVTGYMKDGNIVAGGQYDSNERYIEPTLLDNVKADSPVMQEEIFGPIFPILEFQDCSEVIDFITKREKPLALYYFGNEKDGWDIIRKTSSGGACINDTIMHIGNDRLPFGGVGNSGMGHYHGCERFNACSHQRSIVATPTWTDLPFRYMPYKFIRLMRLLLK